MASKDLKKMLGNIYRPLKDIRRIEALPTGFPEIDDYIIGIGGIPRGGTVEISGPPHSGKSTLALNISKNVINNGGRVVWYSIGEGLDITYAEKIGIDPDKFIVPPFSSGDEAFYQIKLLLALNEIDLIIVDTIAALTPENIQSRVEVSRKQNEKLSLPSLIAAFANDLQGGYEIMDPNTKKPILSNVEYPRISKGKSEVVKTIHKLEDKKTCIIFINRELPKTGIAWGDSTYSPGGVHKEHLIGVKLILYTDRGKFGQKDGIKDQLKYRIMRITNKKNKVGGIPFRQTELVVWPDGTITSKDAIGKKNERLEFNSMGK